MFGDGGGQSLLCPLGFDWTAQFLAAMSAAETKHNSMSIWKPELSRLQLSCEIQLSTNLDWFLV